MLCVGVCEPLSPIGTRARTVSSSAFRNLTPPQNKNKSYSLGEGQKLKEEFTTYRCLFPLLKTSITRDECMLF